VVSSIEALTEDSVAVSLAVPADLRGEFTYQAGQHLILVHDGLRRTYSICSPAGSAQLRIGVKKVRGGAVSSWLRQELRAGDAIEVLPPRGQFTTSLNPAHRTTYAAITAGSGITPVLSLAATVLDQEPLSQFAIVYGNRGASSIMFLEELEDLKNRHPDRFTLLHVLSREPRSSELLSGRLDRDRIGRIVADLLPVGDVDEWFLSGPIGVVETARELLRERGVAPKRIHREIFHADASPAPVTAAARPGGEPDPAHRTQVSARLGARAVTVAMDRDRETVLDAILRARPDAPYACRGGVCGTCRALVTDGEVRMDRSYALDDAERAAGYVLACQSHPVSAGLALDFDRLPAAGPPTIPQRNRPGGSPMIGSPALYFEDLPTGYELEGSAITVTEAHVVAYAGIVGDFYKLHMNAAAAEQSPFGARVAHGPFTFALTIGQIAQRLTHLDVQVEAIVGADNMRFRAPVFFGDTLTPLGKVISTRQRAANGAVTIALIARNQHGNDVFTGEFTLFVASRAANAA
jgi:ring-1,2-phenylacetyl-CoA epoxidase subunit PaaE